MLATNKVQTAMWESNFTATPSVVGGAILTASATPHAKGNYATLIAAATYDSYGFWLRVGATALTSNITDMLIDIAIGASQENIILPEFMCGWIPSATLGASGIWIPIFIPKGSKISGRIQALMTIDNAQVEIVLNGGTSAMPGPLFAGCDAYGTNISTSTGTSHTPGNSGAESTDANIGEALSKNYGAVMIRVQGSSATTINIAYHWELTIGGVTICEWYTISTITELVHGPFPPAPFFASLPVGTHLQVQAEASGTAQAHFVAFYCFY